MSEPPSTSGAPSHTTLSPLMLSNPAAAAAQAERPVSPPISIGSSSPGSSPGSLSPGLAAARPEGDNDQAARASLHAMSESLANNAALRSGLQNILGQHSHRPALSLANSGASIGPEELVIVPAEDAGGDTLSIRFHLNSLLRISAEHKKHVRNLIQNGLYYLTVNNVISALAAFSSASAYVYALQTTSAVNKALLQPTMAALLGYVETLQEKTKSMCVTGAQKTDGKKEDEKEDIDIQCEVFGCEKDKSALCLTFKDVIGMAKEKQVFFDAITQPLIYPNLYTKGAKGILLYGPPGTGKTFLVKAAIREFAIRYNNVKVLFFPLTGADLKGKYVGETEQKIVRAYECASRRACQMTDLYNLSGPKKCKTTEEKIKERLRKLKELKLLSDADADVYKPTDDGVLKKQYEANGQFVSVLFIDEFDSIGGDRTKDDTGLVANAVNTFLQMIDGTESKENVITICATNYPWNLDGALIRRFSEQVYCNVPSFEDVKRLITKEQEDRFKLKKRNLLNYCAEKVKKIFNPSEEIKQIVEKEEIKEKKDCETEINEKSVLDLIDTRYMKEDSYEMMSLVAEMVEKNYSNSDIANVMLKAFNSVSESSLRSSVWIKTTHDSTKYCISKLTKLKSHLQDATLIEKEFSKLQESANVITDYHGITEDANASRRLRVDMTGQQIDGIHITTGHLHMDEEYTKTIFPDSRSKEEEDKNPENQLTSIVIKDKVYTNIRFIKDLPSILMFNDDSIGDMFYDIEQIKTLKTHIATYENQKTKDNFKTLKNYNMSVVFSKAMKINYKNQVYNDNIDSVALQCYALSKTIHSWDPNYKKQDILNLIIKLSWLLFYLKDFLNVQKKRDFYSQFGAFFSENGPILKAPAAGAPPLPAEKRAIPMDCPNDDAGAILWANRHVLIGWSSFDSGIDVINSIFKFENMEFLSTDSKANFLKTKLTTLSTKISAAGNQALTLQEIQKLKDCHDLVNFMNSSAESMCNKAIGAFDEFDGDDHIILKTQLKKCMDFDNFRKVKPINEPPEDHYKVFYFHSNIYPYDGAWVHWKSGGYAKATFEYLRDLFKGGYDSLIGYLFKNSEAVQKEQVIESIMSRIESAKVSALKYLLNRVSGIGICDGLDDRIPYRSPIDNIMNIPATPGSEPGQPQGDPPQGGLPPGDLPPGGLPPSGSHEVRAVRRDMLQVRTDAAASVSGATVPLQDGQGAAVSGPRPSRVAEVLARHAAQQPASTVGSHDGGKHRKTYKSRRATIAAKTYKNTHAALHESYIMHGGADAATTVLYWFDISKSGKKIEKEKVNLKSLFGNQEFMREIVKYDDKGEPSKWRSALKDPVVYGTVGAAAGLAVGAFTLLTGGLAGITIGAALSALGVAVKWGAIGAAVGGTISVAASMTEATNTYVREGAMEFIFNDIIGSISTVENVEDDIYIVNLMVASIFSKNSFDVVKTDGGFLWRNEFKPSFYQNYQQALSTRIRFWSQFEVIPSLAKDAKNGALNLKHIINSKSDVKKDNYLSFFMDVSFIGKGMKAYPSTYNPVTGKMLNDYYRNRVKFIEDYQSGKYDKKKKE